MFWDVLKRVAVQEHTHPCHLTLTHSLVDCKNGSPETRHGVLKQLWRSPHTPLLMADEKLQALKQGTILLE